MTTIWKYIWPLPQDRVEFDMPKGAKVLSVNEQAGHLCLWALVDDVAEKEKRKFSVVGTGHSAPDTDDSKHLGTILMHGGSLVLHVFEPLVNDNA